MEKLKSIKELKKGDRILATGGAVARVISLYGNELFYFNEKTNEFRTKIVNVNDFVKLAI